MSEREGTEGIQGEEVAVLARLAGLTIEPEREGALAAALDADMRPIRRLRALDVGEAVPAGLASRPEEARRGGR